MHFYSFKFHFRRSVERSLPILRGPIVVANCKFSYILFCIGAAPLCNAKKQKPTRPNDDDVLHFIARRRHRGDDVVFARAQ